MTVDVVSLKNYLEREKDKESEMPDFFYECLDYFESEGFALNPSLPANSNRRKPE